MEHAMRRDTPPPTVTSPCLQRLAEIVLSGRHPLLAGSGVADRVLLEDQPLTLPDALAHIGRSSFDLHVRIDPVDGLQVVAGLDLYEQALDEEPLTDGQVEESGTPTRLERLASFGDAVRDDFELLRRLVSQPRVSVVAEMAWACLSMQDPTRDEVARERLARFQRVLVDATFVAGRRNTVVMTASRLERVPQLLLDTCPDLAPIDVGFAGRRERRRLLEQLLARSVWPDEMTAWQQEDVIDTLASLTDGQTLRSVEALVTYARDSRTSVGDPHELVRRYRSGGPPTDPWNDLARRMPRIVAALEERVAGQPSAVAAVAAALRASALGLRLARTGSTGTRRPRAVLLFVGPTGTGKTELAKAIAGSVFGDEAAYVRIDLNTYRAPHDVTRLVGVAPGYIGHEAGGELTNAVRSQPYRLVLFDEIDKAHPEVLTMLMGLFDDGRLVDGQGRVVDFGDTLVVATSNLGASDIREVLEHNGSHETSFAQIREASLRAVWRAFADRPHDLGRFDQTVTFDVLRPPAIAALTERLLGEVAFASGPRLEHDIPSAHRMAEQVMADPSQQLLGGRAIRNAILRDHRELASWLATHAANVSSVRVTWEDQVAYASVEGAEPTRITTPEEQPPPELSYLKPIDDKEKPA